jgi:hypothetical protein
MLGQSVMLNTIFTESLFVLFVILGFGFCGIGLLLPFASTSRFWFLAAPFVGMLIIPFGALAFYSVLDIPYQLAGLIAAICCVIAAIARSLAAPLTCGFPLQRSILLVLVLCFVAIVAAAIVTCDYVTLNSGGPAIVYMHGRDQAGYGQLADWLNTHTVAERPVASPDRPYDSWPDIMFALDPRFSSFGLLAIVATLHGTSGFFAYNVTCAIVMAGAVLALVGLFADTVVVLCVVAVGLLLSHWVDYTHIGFFGKVLSYPAVLMVAGLAMNCRRSVDSERVFYIMVLASAAGIVHSGPAASLLCASVLGPAFAAQAAAETDRTHLNLTAIMYGGALLAPTIASGIAARPTSISFPGFRLSWLSQLPQLLDLAPQFNVTGGPPNNLKLLVTINLLIWAVLLLIALRRRAVRGIGLIAGPAILLILLFAFNARAAAHQLIGFYYPALICGSECLLSGSLTKRQFNPMSEKTTFPWLTQGIILLLLLISIAGRVPRFIGMINQYVRDPPAGYTFSKSEFDQLATKIGDDSVKVDIDNVQRAIPVLIEFGHRKLNVQWTARSWETILGYRTWRVPNYATPPTFFLNDADGGAGPGEVVWQSPRYRLSRIPTSR